MKYGLSIEHALPEALPEKFSAVSLPAGRLQQDAWPERFADAELLRIVTEPADTALFRMMPEEAFRVRLAFQAELEQHLAELAALPVNMVILAPDMERMAAEPAFAENVRVMLRSAAASLAGTQVRLAVSLRLPHPEGTDLVPFLMNLLQSVPGLRAAVELHPHEPAMAAWKPETLTPLRMLSPVLQIVYERALGNRITEKILTPVRQIFAGLPHEPVMLFRPGDLEPAALSAELAELEKRIGL